MTPSDSNTSTRSHYLDSRMFCPQNNFGHDWQLSLNQKTLSKVFNSANGKFSGATLY